MDFSFFEEGFFFSGWKSNSSKKKTLISPCTKVCVMDAENRYCLGCARTLEEITRWSEMSEAERGEVMAKLPARQAEPPSASPTAAAS